MHRLLSLGALLPALVLGLLTNPARGVDPRKSTTPTPTAFIVPTTPAPGTAVTPVSTSTTVPPASSLPGARDRSTAVAPPASPGSGASPLLMPPNSPSRGPRWRIGVYSQDTEVGVKILRVVPNSPADRVGLEPEDYIVAVAGYQVGIVNGQQYDCGYEFEQRADPQGRCMLLVFDNRSRQLVNLPIQLESRLAKVTGTIAYRSRIFLPQNAMALVELREWNSNGSPGIVFGQQRIEEIRQIPIPFEIEYDPGDINPRRTYVVTATITANGRPLYTTIDQYPVLTNGRGATASITVERAAFDPQTAAADQRAEIEQQIIQYFRMYFGRDPMPQEMPLWTAQVTERGRTLFDVQADMASNRQVWERCQQDEARYIELLSESLIGKKPSPEELDYWLWRYQQSGGVRRQLAEDFLTAAGVPR